MIKRVLKAAAVCFVMGFLLSFLPRPLAYILLGLVSVLMAAAFSKHIVEWWFFHRKAKDGE